MQSDGFIEVENTFNQFATTAFNNHEITEVHNYSTTKWIKSARSALNTIPDLLDLQLFLCKKCLASLPSHQQTTEMTTRVIAKDLG
jgi:hypothetical protein